MPLSEHEQRVLAELEESLVRQDPRFAQRVAAKTVYKDAGNQCKWAGLGFLVGLAVLVAFYTESVPLGLLGVALMFGSAVVFERGLRRLGRAGWHDLRQPGAEGEHPMHAEGALGGTREWLRSHVFRREH